MERISNIALILGACVVGLMLFILGYSTVRYYQKKGKWAREFWISVAIVLVFLYSTFCVRTENPAKTKELLKQLGNEDWEIREKAQQDLIKIGKFIRPYLEPLLEDKDPEVKIRVRKIWADLQFDIEDRITEVKKTTEWRQLRKLFKELVKCMPLEKENEIGNEKILNTLKQQHEAITKKIEALGEDSSDGIILSVKSSLIQISAIAGKVIQELYPINKTCYDMSRGPLPRKNKDYQIQQELLDRNLKEGKITKEVYEKIKKTIVQYERNASMSEREYMIDGLNHTNTVLIFRLLQEVYSP